VTGPTRVLVVDDHSMFAAGVSQVLGAEDDIDVVAQVGDLASARRHLAVDPVDVVLLDQRLPDGNGVDALPELRSLAPAARVVVLTGAADEATMVRAMENGCAGFLEKDRTIEDLVLAVRSAAAGEAMVSPALLARLIARMHRGTPSVGADLTPREREVLSLVAEGLGNADIGRRLHVSVNTVRNHVANVLAKLGAHSKLEALSVAVREGLLPGGPR
jgi:DNA-binding NarL/FixJ family response regulator